MNNLSRLQITEGMWTGWMGKILYVPLLNILVLLYTYIPGQDLGLAIIALTIIIRMVLYPSYRNSLKAPRDLQKVQPYIDQIKEQYKDDPQKQSQEMMKVYKDNQVNLFGSCLPLIIQLPILLALYRVFIAGLSTDSLQYLYSWFPNAPTELHTHFLAFLGNEHIIIDLTTRNIWLAIAAAVAQLVQSLMAMKYTSKNRPPKSGFDLNKIIPFVFPVVTLFIALSLPSALALYWITMTVVMAIQQTMIYRSFEREEASVATVTHHDHDEDRSKN